MSEQIVVDDVRARELLLKLAEIAQHYTAGELAIAYGYYVALSGRMTMTDIVPKARSAAEVASATEVRS